MYNKQMRWKVKASFDGTACAFSSNCMKNYQYRRTAVEIIAEGWVIYFFAIQCILVDVDNSH